MSDASTNLAAVDLSIASPRNGFTISTEVRPGAATVLYRPSTSSILIGQSLRVHCGDIRIIMDKKARAIKVAVADQGLWVDLYMYKGGRMCVTPDYAIADRLVETDLALLPIHVVQQATERDPVVEEMAWEICDLKADLDGLALNLQIARAVLPGQKFERVMQAIAA